MKRLALLILLSLPAASAAGLEPYLVKDIQPVPGAAGSGPSYPIAFRGAALFVADGGDGHDLWRSDGTAAGTFPLTSAPNSKFPPEPFLVTARLYFFLANGNRGGSYLWVSDGTQAGTFALTGPELGQGGGVVVLPWRVWAASQGVLYFVGRDLEHGEELWRSDGTPAGTHMVADIRPGPASATVRWLAEYRGRVWFGADDGERGGALWSTDGTAAGTVLEVDPVPSSAVHESPVFIQAVGRRLTFVAPSPGQGPRRQLWAGDGTARGTKPVTGLSRVYEPVVHGNRLYFIAEDKRSGQELWVSDGTARGTRALTSFPKRRAFFSDIQLDLRNRQGLPGLFVFAADDGPHGVEPWVTDGTPRGTRLVMDICPGACGSLPGPGEMYAGRLWFAAQESRGRELWSTNGRATGTFLAHDVCPGSCDSNPQALTAFDGRLVFVAEAGGAGQQVWSIDGTALPAVRLSDFEDFHWEDGYVGRPLGAILGGQLLFGGSERLHGSELWRTDGTPAGTWLVEDINRTDFGGSFPWALRPVGDEIIFVVPSDAGIPELWKSDGTAAGTARLRELGLEGGIPEGAFAEAGGLLFYFAHDTVWNRTVPWRTDGTEAGTFPLSGESVPQCCQGQEMRALGSTVFFDLWDADHGRELWASDGTKAGTRLVLDVMPGEDGSDPTGLTAFQGRLWFAAEGEFTGRELWMSDGTAAGTELVADIHPDGHAGSAPTFLTVHAGRLWFFADDGEHGRELWSSDGTADGTALAVEFEPGSGFLEVELVASLGGRLVVSARDQGLWVTDGTPAGTRKIHGQGHDPFGYRDVWTVFQGRLYYVNNGAVWVTDGTEAGTGPLLGRNGDPVWGPAAFAILGDRLVISASDSSGRRVPWESDGTPAGTFPLQPAISLYDPTELVRAGNRVFFPGSDRLTGTELWAIR